MFEFYCPYNTLFYIFLNDGLSLLSFLYKYSSFMVCQFIRASKAYSLIWEIIFPSWNISLILCMLTAIKMKRCLLGFPILMKGLRSPQGFCIKADTHMVESTSSLSNQLGQFYIQSLNSTSYPLYRGIRANVKRTHS